MTAGLAARGKKQAGGAGACAVALAFGTTLLVTAPAHATDPPVSAEIRPITATTPPFGTIARGYGTYERDYPYVIGKAVHHLPHGSQVNLKCQIVSPDGPLGHTWYRLRDRPTWIPSQHVAVSGPLPTCTADERP